MRERYEAGGISLRALAAAVNSLSLWKLRAAVTAASSFRLSLLKWSWRT